MGCVVAFSNLISVLTWPIQVKPKYLEGLKVDDVSSKKSLKVGTMARKYVTFDIWSVGSETGEDTFVGGEEIRHLKCLLPRKKKGKLYEGEHNPTLPHTSAKRFIAPRGIARHLVLSAQPAKPTPPEPGSIPPKDPTSGKYQNPHREGYSEELLTHAFAPIGSHAVKPVDADATMEVDEDAKTALPASPSKKEKKEKEKSKKRKGAAEEVEEAPATKKSKKSKSSA